MKVVSYFPDTLVFYESSFTRYVLKYLDFIITRLRKIFFLFKRLHPEIITVAMELFILLTKLLCLPQNP